MSRSPAGVTPARPVVSRAATAPATSSYAPTPGAAQPSASTPRSIGAARTIGAAARALARKAAPAPAQHARPHLTLVTPEHPPLARSIAAERLAAHTGGSLEQGEGGLSTVHFPPPAEPALSTFQPYTVSRELADPAPATTTTQSSSADTGATPGGGEKGEAMDPETLYEYFLDRFKRDLLIEREQLGHLIIDNP